MHCKLAALQFRFYTCIIAALKCGHFSAGQRIPADIRVLESKGLRVETTGIDGSFSKLVPINALNSGSSQAFEYTHEAVASHVSVVDSRNVAFRGSYCTEGDGMGVVIRTGRYTVSNFDSG